MKECYSCKEQKSEEQFRVTKGSLFSYCKCCESIKRKAYRKNNIDRYRELDKKRYREHSEKIKEKNKLWADKNKDIRSQYNRERYQKDPQKQRELKKQYRKYNKSMIYYLNGTRRAQLRLAMPKWVNRKEIKSIYQHSYSVSITTGIRHHVDHIIPLKGKLVSGLHVPWNLQVIPWKENLTKGSKYVA